MNYFKYLCDKIAEGIMQKFSIAMLAVSFWIINADGMSTENLKSVIESLGFQFDESTYVLSVGETSYNIYQLLDYCIVSVYPVERTLNPPILKCIIKKCEKMEYITPSQSSVLQLKLNN